MNQIIIFYKDAQGIDGNWIVQMDRLQHCLKVLEAKGFIVTGYQNIV